MKRKGVYSGLFDRLRSGFTVGLACFLGGVLLYYAIGCFTGMNAGYGRRLGSIEDDVWSLRRCVYQAAVTFTTIGYGDELGTNGVRVYRHPGTGAWYAYNTSDGLVPEPGAAPAAIGDLDMVEDFTTATILTTVLLAFTGMVVFLYVIGAITAFFVEGGYVQLRAQARLEKEVGRLRDHVIVCGAGPLGLHAIGRLLDEGLAVLAVEHDESHVRRLREAHPSLLVLPGDPTDIEVLHEAGLARARGIVDTLPDDNDSLVVIVTAKQENPRLRILAATSNRETAARLRKAGAHEVVASSFLGGMRIASEAIRPTVVRFLDGAMGHEEEHHGFRFVGLRVDPGTPAAGLSLADSRFSEETGLPVLALRRPGERGFTYNPGPGEVLDPGTVLGVLASDPDEARARAFLSSGPAGGGA